MQFRQLGNSDLNASALGLGCMSMSEFYGPIDHKEAEATLIRAVELGVNFFDTADFYGSGANEELLGRVLQPYRNKLIIASKFGLVRDPKNPKIREVNGRPEYVKACCDASLKRLGIEVIDLYYLHRVDKKVPIEETVGAMAELIKKGKVRYLGLSEANTETISRAQKVHPLTAIQSEYSLTTREHEKTVLPLCEKLNISFVPYSPLGRGLLTHKITSLDQLDATDARRMLSPRFVEENMKQNLKLVEALEEIAHNKSCTSGQLALAWVLAKSEKIVPIPGTKHRKYLEENMGALQVILSRNDVAEIDELFKPEAIAGARYHAEGLKALDE